MPHQVQTVYYQSDIEHHGLLVLPEQAQQPLPSVLIAHAWNGRDTFVEEKAYALADLGYAAFAIDMYGEGKTGNSNAENAQLMQPLKDDRGLLLRRMQVAYAAAQDHIAIDENRIAAIGYCFGGLCVLDLARSGSDIKGVVSFHGILNPPETLIPQSIKAKLLVLHGYNDPMAKPDMMLAFMQEMDTRQVDWQLHAYGNTSHAFTKPGANDPALGLHYSASADQRSWQTMQQFLREVLSL